MKTKTKKKTKVSVKKSKQKTRHFEPHFLALALVAVLLFEGFTFSATTKTDWQEGLQVLDVSTSFTTLVSDVKTTFQPITNTIEDVNTFYQLAADEATFLLDLSDTDVFAELNFVTGGVASFYEEASNELAYLLDFSETQGWPSTVSGAFTSSY